MNKTKQAKRKIKELQKQIERIDNNSMIKIEISGVIKKRVTKIIDIPINNTIKINEYLFRDKKEKKELIEKIKNEFPKGSIINIKEVEIK